MGARIVLNKKDSTIKVVNRKDSIKVERKEPIIKLQHAGKTGPTGEPGAGVPDGGLPGQVLVKAGVEDNQTAWASIDGSDKYYIQNFLASSLVTVPHNLAKYPSVTVHDSSGDEVEGEVEHTDINSLRITFSAPFSGTVTCN